MLAEALDDTGSRVPAAELLAFLRSAPLPVRDEWMANSLSGWSGLLGITPFQMKGAIRQLSELGLIQVERYRAGENVGERGPICFALTINVSDVQEKKGDGDRVEDESERDTG